MRVDLSESWQKLLADEFTSPYFEKLAAFIDQERSEHQVFPPEDEVFFALNTTPYEATRVLLLGQDPYHDVGQAHGMAFSVRPGVRPPPSLLNIFKELTADTGCPMPRSGYLVPWAQQGVLLLNAVLTVRAHQANSHKGRGWEQFTDAVIRRLSAREDPLVFILWGGYAGKKLPLIDTSRNTVIQSAHPSPLSAHNGFFGSRPFSAVNRALQVMGKPPVDWRL